MFLAPVLAFGQSANFSGKVVDEAGDPIAGASVVIQSLSLGSATDVDGNYSFRVPANSVNGQTVKVVAKFIGYRSQSHLVQVTAGIVTQDFTLAEDVLKMEAIVVTGVAEETPREKLSFSVGQVSKETLEQAPSTQGAVAGLQGKVAGVRIVSGNGAPGSGVSVNLRASTSIRESSQPLYIVDGVILSADQVDIDALDIESIEVVKGAAASSLYGSRAQNGVVQIRTNRGSNNALNQTRVKIRSEIGQNQLSSNVELSKSHEFLVDAEGNWIDATGAAVDRLDRVLDSTGFQDNKFKGPLYDNIDLFFDPGTFYSNNVTLTHNSARTNFMTSMGNNKQGGIIVGLDGYERKNMRLNLDHSINDRFKIQFTGYYSRSTSDDLTDGDNPNPFFGLMFINPDANLLAKNEDGTPFIIQPDPNTLEENPLYATHNADIKIDRQRFLGGLNARYDFNDYFNIEGNVSYDRSDRNRSEHYIKGYKSIDANTLNDGRLYRNNLVDQAFNSSITATFNRQFGDLSTLTKAQYLYEDSDFAFFEVQGNKLKIEGITDLDNVEGEKFIGSRSAEIRALGYFFTTRVDYKDRYIADFLFRRDGSSLFGSENRWNNYTRFSAAYRLGQEEFWPFEDVNEFKFRISVGQAGNRPRFVAQYQTYSLNDGNVSKATLGNDKLKPELQTEVEFGLDFTVFDRISAELTLANSTIEEALLDVPKAGYVGFPRRWENAASLETTTFEATLNGVVLRTNEMSLDVGLIMDKTTQEIKEFNQPAYRTGPGGAFYYRDNEDFGAMYGRLFMSSKGQLDTHQDGLFAGFKDYFDVNDDGYLVAVGQGNSWKDGVGKELWGTSVDIDTDGDGTPDAALPWGMPFYLLTTESGDFHKIGNTIPDFNLGFNTSFRWKGFSAFALIHAQFGGDIYNNTRQWSYRELRHGDVDQAGKADSEKKPVDYYNALYNTNSVNSAFVEDGSYVKLRELNLSYTFDKGFFQNLLGGSAFNLFNSMKLGFIGRNLLTFTDYSGFDPEVGQGDATIRAFDGFRYPNFRTFTGFVEFEF
jgi:TonB-linked SusC/RagA family outer membrane protein